MKMEYVAGNWQHEYVDRPGAVRPPAPPTREGVVYFIAGEVGFIKIGFTVDLAARLKTLQCGSPIPLSILATVPGRVSLEKHYHLRFHKHRQHGEWFERCPEIEAEIAITNEQMRHGDKTAAKAREDEAREALARCQDILNRPIPAKRALTLKRIKAA